VFTQDELTERIISVIAKVHQYPADMITACSSLEELGVDSLDSVNILFALEEEFNVSIPDEGKKLRTVQEIVDGLEQLLSGGDFHVHAITRF